MSEWIELTGYSDNQLILIRKSAVASVSKNDNGIVCIYTLGDGDNYFLVNESYDEIKNMLARPDMIEMKYSDEDKERIEKWIEELQAYPVIPLTGSIIREI